MSNNWKIQTCSRSLTFCLSTLHPLQAGSGHPALLWMECLCRGYTVRKGDTASCSHGPTLILWSPQAPPTIPDQPLAPERVGLNGQQGRCNNLVDQTHNLTHDTWPVMSLGERRQERRYASVRTPTCVFLAGVYMQLTHHT